MYTILLLKIYEYPKVSNKIIVKILVGLGNMTPMWLASCSSGFAVIFNSVVYPMRVVNNSHVIWILLRECWMKTLNFVWIESKFCMCTNMIWDNSVCPSTHPYSFCQSEVMS